MRLNLDPPGLLCSEKADMQPPSYRELNETHLYTNKSEDNRGGKCCRSDSLITPGDPGRLPKEVLFDLLDKLTLIGRELE
jgi:hypothetical protein